MYVLLITNMMITTSPFFDLSNPLHRRNKVVTYVGMGESYLNYIHMKWIFDLKFICAGGKEALYSLEMIL